MQRVRPEEDSIATLEICRAPNLALRHCDASVYNSLTRMLPQAAMVRTGKEREGAGLTRAVAERYPNSPEVSKHPEVVRVLMRLRRQVEMRRENATSIGCAQA